MTSVQMQYSNLPEVVPDSGPQVLFRESPMVFVASPDEKPDFEIHATSVASNQAKIPFWRTRKAWILSIVVLAVVEAAVIGTAVGVSANKQPPPEL